MVIDLLSNAIFMTAISALVGSLITLFITRNNNRKDLAINDRVQLSKDQYQLISELRLMIAQQKEETDNLQDRMKELQEVNISLIFENKNLIRKLDVLNDKLEELKESKTDGKSNVVGELDINSIIE